MQDLLEENVNIRVEAGVSSALDELKKLCGKTVSQVCRDLMSEAIQARLLNDSERPLAPALVKRYVGLSIFELYRDFVFAQQARPGYTFIESIKIGGVTRYIIATPGHVVPAGKDYWQGVGEMLMRGGLPEGKVPEAIELLKVKMQKTTKEVEAKNKARKDALRKSHPDKAAEADEVIRAAEEAEKTEG